jgi:multidrug efflux pump subunit AcrA (membrane-fusion protein)
LGAAAEEVSAWDRSELEPGTRVFNVVIDLVERDPEHLMTGMSASVEIITRRLSRTVYIRKECIFDEGEHHIVYVRQGNTFQATRVTPGAENARFVQIREGLRPGQSIARQRPIRDAEAGL